MNDEKDQTSADGSQSKPNNVGDVEVVGRRRRDRVEIKVPRGIVVMQAADRDGTKIVLLGFVGDKRQGIHGNADEGV